MFQTGGAESNQMAKAEAKATFLQSLGVDGVRDFTVQNCLERRRQALSAPLRSLKSLGIRSMVDVGSGEGFTARLIADEIGALDLKCYDVTEPANNVQSEIAMVRDASEHITLFDGVSLPEQSGAYELASAIYVLHHAGDNALALLSDMARVSQRWLLVAEDLHETPFQERNRLHDPNGYFLDRHGWLRVFDRLGLSLHDEGRLIADGPQHYFLLRK